MSKWFLFGAVVGFLILLFKFERFFAGAGAGTGRNNVLLPGIQPGNGAGAGSGTAPSRSGCGCGSTITLSPVADVSPDTAGPGATGQQWRAKYGNAAPLNPSQLRGVY